MFIENILYKHLNFNDEGPTLSQLIQADHNPHLREWKEKLRERK